jgi:hypothetical protein
MNKFYIYVFIILFFIFYILKNRVVIKNILYKKLNVILLKYSIINTTYSAKDHTVNKSKININIIPHLVNKDNIQTVIYLFNNLSLIKTFNNDIIFIFKNSIIYFNHFYNRFIRYNFNNLFKKLIKCILIKNYNQIIFNFSVYLKKLKNILNNSQNVYFDLSNIFKLNIGNKFNYKILIIFLYNIL